jgi:hypothetical protein
MVTISEALNHYKKAPVQQAILEVSKNREVIGSFDGKGFASRPDILRYPQDILELVRQGITSFHASEERWKNPLHLNTEMNQRSLLNMRKGWDLVLDIDCESLELSKFAGFFLVEALKHNGLNNFSVKFSGNHGFHIGVPFEFFPGSVNGNPINELFPEAPKKIAFYLMDLVRERLSNFILTKFSLQDVSLLVNKEKNDLFTKGKFDAFRALSLDTVLLSSRHLYRMPYSFNEKSGLLSIPIEIDSILNFKKEMAKYNGQFEIKNSWLDISTKDDASKLILNSYDHNVEISYDLKIDEKREYDEINEAIPENMFPECIKKILCGLEDGRKRAIFLLIGFLRSVGWGKDEVVDRIKEWNKVNREPLREVYLRSQFDHNFRGKARLPPNCTNEAYYEGLSIHCGDKCRFKNPVAYTKRRFLLNKPRGRDKLTDEQKAMRKAYRDKKRGIEGEN